MSRDSLYVINNDYLDAIDVAMLYAEENDGVIDDALANELEAIGMTRDDKINNTGMFIKNKEHLINALKKEEGLLKERRAKHEKRVEQLKNFLWVVLQGDKFESEKCRIRHRKSEQTIITDEDDVPDNFITIEQKPVKKVDKKAIKEYIKEHGPVGYATVNTKYTTYVE